MSPKTSVAPATRNYPLLALWVAAVVVTVGGYVLMTSSNAGQANFYVTGSTDYSAYFALQSGSSLGATLTAVGVLGLLIALATQARLHAAQAASRAVADVTDEASTDDGTYAPATAAAPTVAESVQTDAAAPAETPAAATQTVGDTPAASAAGTASTDGMAAEGDQTDKP